MHSIPLGFRLSNFLYCLAPAFLDWFLLFKLFLAVIFTSFVILYFPNLLPSVVMAGKGFLGKDKGMPGPPSKGTLVFRELLEISEENYEQQMIAAVSF